jgi:Domain of unknown function (DUF3291)
LPKHVIAQLNIAQMKAPLESRIMAEFVFNLDRINARGLYIQEPVSRAPSFRIKSPHLQNQESP